MATSGYTPLPVPTRPPDNERPSTRRRNRVGAIGNSNRPATADTKNAMSGNIRSKSQRSSRVRNAGPYLCVNSKRCDRGVTSDTHNPCSLIHSCSLPSRSQRVKVLGQVPAIRGKSPPTTCYYQTCRLSSCAMSPKKH